MVKGFLDEAVTIFLLPQSASKLEFTASVFTFSTYRHTILFLL